MANGVLRLPSGNDPATLSQVGGWRWGAFAFPWIWLLAHGLPVWGVLLLVGDLMTSGVLSLVARVYLGLKGGEIAWRHRRFRNLADFRSTERVWDWCGIGVLSLLVAAVVLLLVFLAPAFPGLLQVL